MKKFFFGANFIFLIFSAAFVGFGVYLNSTSDSYIETMTDSRVVNLSGVTASYRDIAPELYLDYVAMKTERQADAIAQIDGFIEEFYVSQGQEVTRGQPLCKITNNELSLAISRANADIAKAEASYANAASTVERNKRLASEDAIAASELEFSISQMQATKAELDAAKIAKQQMEQQKNSETVTAPVPGSIIIVYHQAGNAVTKGSPIVMIADFSKMYFITLVEDDMIKNILPLEGKYTLRTPLGNMTQKAFDSAAKSSFSEDTAFSVKLVKIEPPLSENTPARSVTFEIDNSLGVMELGMYTDIVIRKDTPKNVLAVPQNAVRENYFSQIYVCDEDSRLAVRNVKTGIYDSEFVEIREGLDEGDVIITSGIEGLEIGTRIDVDLEDNVQ